jgi:hypothetical protein
LGWARRSSWSPYARCLNSEQLRRAPSSPAAVAAHWRIGGALAAFWVIPFVAKGSWMAKYGELWKSLPADGQRGFGRARLFDNAMPPVIILGRARWRRCGDFPSQRGRARFCSAYAAATHVFGVELPRFSGSTC